MISVEQARQLISEACKPLSSTIVALEQAAGSVAATAIAAPIHLPPFNQSGMDGYAFRYADYGAEATLAVTQHIPAGHNQVAGLAAGEAARIFTGAPLPMNADTVVMQEQTERDGDLLLIKSTGLKQGDNTRLTGAEIKKGDIAIPQGVTLSPSAIAFLAGMGITHVEVYGRPRVSLIITGNELQIPGTPLQHGQVYESSSYALKAAFMNLPADLLPVRYVKDKEETIQETLTDALLHSDMVLLTGGVSVGEYDFVSAAAEAAGITRIFHRVKQRPGKPLFFGQYGDKPVFGLPGNPSSVLTCFYQYVIPAIYRLNGSANGLVTLKVPLAKAYEKKAGLTHFLKGQLKNGEAYQLTAQESYRLSSFARATCLIAIPEAVERAEEGNLVEIHLIPGS